MKLHNPTESLAKKEYRKQTIFQVRLLARGRQKKPAKPVAMRVHVLSFLFRCHLIF